VSRPKYREELVANARRIRNEIQQIFTDVASWNEFSVARRNGADPIDPDPDGRMAGMLEQLNRFLADEDARPLPVIDVTHLPAWRQRRPM
jgi:hypothetical protein